MQQTHKGYQDTRHQPSVLVTVTWSMDELDRFLAPFRRLRDPDTLLDEPDNADTPDNQYCAVVTSLFIRLFCGVVNNLFATLQSLYPAIHFTTLLCNLSSAVSPGI
jgi:hypothetical protein